MKPHDDPNPRPLPDDVTRVRRRGRLSLTAFWAAVDGKQAAPEKRR